MDNRLSCKDLVLLKKRFAKVFEDSLAEALALYEANWINSTEFHARMDKRAVSLVQSAHADTTAVAQAGQPASAQLEASLVPFRGGQWLMASMTYSCLDENSRMAQRKAHCLRFLQADSTGAAVIQQPPWGRPTDTALQMSGPTLASMAQQLLAYGIPLVALRLGQGLLPLTRGHGRDATGSVTHGSAGGLAEQMGVLGVAVGPTAPYERAMAEDLQAVAVGESARLARLQLGGGGGGDGMDEDGGGGGGKKDVGSRADQQQQQQQQLERQQQKQRGREQVAAAATAVQELGMEKGGGGGLKRGGGRKQQKQQFCDGDGDGDGEAQPDDSADTILLCTGDTVEMGAIDDGPEYRGSTSGSGTPPLKGLQDKVRRGGPLGMVA